MMGEAALSALELIADPGRLAILFLAVLLGLFIGVVPGLGGIVGLAILIPFTYAMDPFAALAFLVGMGAVTTTSDTIPAVLFGVPGTTGSAATIMDGYPMAKNGEAGRAFGAAYSASLIGGVFGAFLLAISIPILRPAMLFIGSPELFMMAVVGLTMVAALSGSAPMRGMAAAGFGLIASMVGLGSQSGTLRWTFDQLYLWEGLALVPITLGLFALPEVIDMAVTKTRIADKAEGKGDPKDTTKGQLQGIKDVFTHWWLTLKCASLGSILGAVPGMGSAVIDWLAYGYGKSTCKNSETFGKGDVRGVIAPEAANNAKTGGSLVPTLAFGVPGSASMAILLGAFLMHGLVPGPDMLSRNLDVTYGIIFSLALANIIGAGLCLAFANQFAKVALIRFGILVPIICVVIFLGAFQATASWGDIYLLLIAGALGWVMKHLNWPRAPLLLGFVLGEIFERYMWISINSSLAIQGSGMGWMSRPIVIVLAVISAYGIYIGVKPWLKNLQKRNDEPGALKIVKPRVTPNGIFSGLIIIGLLYLLNQALDFAFKDRVIPLAALSAALFFTTISFLVATFTTQVGHNEKIEDELGAGWGVELAKVVAWLLGLTALIYVIGFLPAIAAFMVGFMVLVGKERMRLSVLTVAGVTVFSYVVFHMGINVNWVPSMIGDAFPALREMTGFL